VLTVDVNGTSYQGEWVQIQKPSSIILSNYSVSTDTTNPLQKWFLLGSRDGVNWYLVDQQSNQTSWSPQVPKTFTVASSRAFNYFRLVANITGGGGVGYGPAIYEMVLNGSIEGPTVSADGRLGVGVSAPVQQLEVAGSAIVAGTMSAGNPLMYRNRIINGDMRIAQRGTSNVLVTLTVCYGVDRSWVYYTYSGGSLTTYQNTLSVTDAPYQQGLLYAMNVACTSTLSGATGQVYVSYGQVVEGYNGQDFNWGTSVGVPVTMSFWFKSSQTGYTSCSIRNKTSYTWSWTSPQLSYPTAGVWQYYTVTVPPPPNGSAWGSGNSSFAEVIINGYQSGIASTGWNNSTSIGWPGQIITTSSGNYVAVTGVQLEKGTIATPFEVRPYATELALCQRYYQFFSTFQAYATTSSQMSVNTPISPTMRAAPTPTVTSTGGSGVTMTIGNITTNSIVVNTTGTAGFNQIYSVALNSEF